MRHRRVCPTLATLICLVAVGTAVADEAPAPALKIGDRVRVLAGTSRGTKLEGRVVATDDVRLVIEAEGTERRTEIDRSAIHRLDVMVGKRRCTAKGALVGALAGAALMAGYFAGDNDLSDNSGTGDVIGGFAFFLVPPTAVGALVGTAVREERWAPVPDHRVAGTHAALLAVRIRF